MTDKDASKPGGRRRFLKGAATVGGASVLMAVGKDWVSAEPGADDKGDNTIAVSPSKGYRLTAHIQSYYNKARI